MISPHDPVTEPEHNGGQKTLNEFAFLQLRQQLLTGLLPPGTPLRLERLKQSLGIGYTPLREALMRLTSEGLVEVEEQRGFRVAAASLADLDHIMQARIEVEASALREAMAHGTEDWEALVMANFHKMSRRASVDAETGGVAPDWAEAHRAFHLSTIAACPNRWLLRFWATLFDQAQRYRHLSVTKGAPYRDDSAEHRRLLDAILSRDLDEALAASRSHIESTRAVVARLLADAGIF